MLGRVSTVVDKIQNIVRTIRSSIKLTSALEKLILMKNPESQITRLIMSNATRWNSTFFMLNRINALRTEIELLLNDGELILQYKIQPITPNEWVQVEILIEILEEFFHELVDVEFEKKATINCTTCSYMFLFKNCQIMKVRIHNEYSFPEIEEGLKDAQSILNKYFNQGSMFCYAGMLFDPRLKDSKYIERGWIEDAHFLNEE